MKPITMALSAITLAFSVNTAWAQLNSTDQKASYTIGVDLANNLKNQGIDIDADAFILGLEDVLKNRKLQLTDNDMKQALDDFRRQLEAKQNERRQALLQTNKQKSEQFLAENLKKPGVKSMESGLQYRVIKQGTGEFAKPNQVLVAHYRGTLIDGTEFDSSLSRGTPIEFKMDNVIEGWQQALAKMNPGSKWEIFVPPHLGYGERGAGNVIGPNETLIFEIELIATREE
jgi:FKBP-type peptidyl-prolyl cis-trans isomerase FklB